MWVFSLLVWYFILKQIQSYFYFPVLLSTSPPFLAIILLFCTPNIFFTYHSLLPLSILTSSFRHGNFISSSGSTVLLIMLSAVCILVTCPTKVIWPTFLSAALWDISALRPVFWRAICAPSSLCWLLGGQPLSTLFFFFSSLFSFCL